MCSSVLSGVILRSKYLCISQFQLRPPPPPWKLRGICLHCQLRGSGIGLSQGYPRAFDPHVVSDSKSKRGRFSRTKKKSTAYESWAKCSYGFSTIQHIFENVYKGKVIAFIATFSVTRIVAIFRHPSFDIVFRRAV